jgi:deazaflavin-dependent oxidoreductase (nitroreductase family)
MPIPPSEVTWNENHVADFRAHGGRITQGPLAGSNLLLLTTTGAKSGEPHVSPLGFTRDGERWVVVASNSGYAHDPAWVANIRADPHVEVEVGTEAYPAIARITTGDERQRLWAAHKAAIPIFERYETMTERELPVVMLERA